MKKLWGQRRPAHKARRDRQAAEQQLAEVRGRHAKVNALAEALRRERERNHFGELIENIYGGREGQQ